MERIMNKFVGILALLSCVLLATEAFARTVFIVDSPSHTVRDKSSSSSHSSTYKNCFSMGYTKTSCPTGERGLEACPMNSQYFKYCCPPEYQYTSSQCREQGLKPTGGSCHGYYSCK